MPSFRRHDLENLNNALRIRLREAGVLNFASDSRNRHSFSRVFLVRDVAKSPSRITNFTTGEVHPMRPGHLYFMPPLCDLGFLFQPEMHFISFHFHAELFGFFDLFQDEVHCRELKDDAKWEPRAREILTQRDADPRATLGGLLRLQALLGEIIGTLLPPDLSFVARRQAAAERFRPVLEHIANKGDAMTTVEELARVAGMARGTLSRGFAAAFGVTLKRYLSRELVRRAEILLLRPGATARQTAEELGFASEYYFSRFFRQHTGTAPGNYRRQAVAD